MRPNDHCMQWSWVVRIICFAGSNAGGDRAALIYIFIGMQDYLSYVFEQIADHPINQVDELLPWHVAPELEVLRSRSEATIPGAA